MNKQVSKSQFKARALELLRQVEATGERLVVTDHGKPVIEVRALREDKTEARDPLDVLRGSVLRYDRPFDPAVPEEEWEALAGGDPFPK
jgi:antitoxin (DNA-binding transcriptional repressor) of toxin-antitoxin stability system